MLIRIDPDALLKLANALEATNDASYRRTGGTLRALGDQAKHHPYRVAGPVLAAVQALDHEFDDLVDGACRFVAK